MKSRSQPTVRRRRAAMIAAIVLAVVLAVVLGPYLFSRAMSPWRTVSLHSTAAAELRPPADETADPFRIVAYNIAHGRGLAESNWQGGTAAERLARLDEIAALLREIDADVVVLNEVDFDASWSHSVNQARYLAEKAGYAHWVEQRNLDFRVLLWKWRFGNAVLSKHPIERADVVDLPGYAGWETLLAGKKRAVAAEVLLGGRRVRVVGAHLCHRSEAVRVDSARLLGELTAGSDVPTVVAGDLNSSPPGFPHHVADPEGRNAMATFDRGGLFRRLPEEPPEDEGQLTFHAADPRLVIDWILIPRGWRFERYEVERSLLSDHRPVWGDVGMGEE